MRQFADSKKAEKIKKNLGVLELNTAISKKEEKKLKKKGTPGEEKIDSPKSPKSPKSKSPPASPLKKDASKSPSPDNVPAALQNGHKEEHNSVVDEDKMIEERRKMLMSGKLKGGKSKKPAAKIEKNEKSPLPKKKGKENRTWMHGGTAKDAATLDYSSGGPSSAPIVNGTANGEVSEVEKAMIGQMIGELKPVDSDEDTKTQSKTQSKESQASSSASGFGGSVFSFFKGLAGQNAITAEAIEPVLRKMMEHLCSKNVATDISEKLCKSVEAKLIGRVLGTFTGVASAVRSSMQESLVQILSPKKRIDILRDVMDAKKRGKPYVIVFCGVNGVGKSTNLAKICFWLTENNHRVMIAACDTFRSGAVEQLRTHTCRLKALHPQKDDGPESVFLYDKGYGKDAAAVSMEAICLARDLCYDVVLVDTAGRMQDNEPLMRSLAKLIKLNEPDLVLFVGEALVGNDGVDQLRKFNQALADHSDVNNPHLIDGIVLTKFDTIDDKVGAAISMTYETGQPIVFVGTGQTYTDLRNLNVNAVVKALLKS